MGVCEVQCIWLVCKQGGLECIAPCFLVQVFLVQVLQTASH